MQNLACKNVPTGEVGDSPFVQNFGRRSSARYLTLGPKGTPDVQTGTGWMRASRPIASYG